MVTLSNMGPACLAALVAATVLLISLTGVWTFKESLGLSTTDFVGAWCQTDDRPAPTADPQPVANCDYPNRLIASYQAQLQVLRKQYTSIVCRSSENTSSTGAWCLFPQGDEEVAPGYPLAFHHVQPDPGIAKTIMSLVGEGQDLLDMGAGIGQYGHYFRKNNARFNWTGYDGALNVEEFTNGFVRWADLTVQQHFREQPFAWVMCMEVGEHVPKEFEADLVDNIHRHNVCGAILTWAVPDQYGHQHINLKSPAALKELMTKLGYTEDEAVGAAGRAVAVYGWFQNTFRVFRKNNAPSWCFATST